MKNSKGSKTPQKLSYNNLKKGQIVSFLRQVVGYPNKILTGKVIGFNHTHNIGVPREYHPMVHIKAECEYGSALEYNHTLHVCEITVIA